MSDDQNQNNNSQNDSKKNDPAKALAAITQFLGAELPSKPKLTRTTLDSILDEMHQDSEERLKEEVKEELKSIITDRAELKKLEQEFEKRRGDIGKKLNERLNKLRQKVEQNTQKRTDLQSTANELASPDSEVTFITDEGNDQTS